MESNSGPGYRQHPEHQVDLEHEKRRVRVTFAGEPIAESDEVITVRETGYDPVYYFPRDSVRMSSLAHTEHHTKCPFKGEASYFSLNVAGHKIENGAWSYEHPYDEVADIKGRIAFYPDKMDAISIM
jgi:uncharacterized protein (DUF427 family)